MSSKSEPIKANNKSGISPVKGRPERRVTRNNPTKSKPILSKGGRKTSTPTKSLRHRTVITKTVTPNCASEKYPSASYLSIAKKSLSLSSDSTDPNNPDHLSPLL